MRKEADSLLSFWRSNMPTTLNQSDQVNTIRLEDNVDITCAAELKNVLLQALESEKELRVEFVGTPELDVSALQLLWAAEREARRLGIGMFLVGRVPEGITATLDDAGLVEFPVPTDPKSVIATS